MREKLQLAREYFVIALIGFLPFHALLVTVGTKILRGPGHAPLATLALWKETALAAILLLAALEILWSKRLAANLRVDPLDALIIALVLVAVVLRGLLQTPLNLFLLGFKYDVLPLIAFLILRLAPWSEAFRRNLLTLLLIVGGVVSLLGVLSLFLPISFFTYLGYADYHSLYVPGGPLSPFQQIGESWIRRIQSTMSGPNQLGIWLLYPWSVLLTFLFQGTSFPFFLRARKKGEESARASDSHSTRPFTPLETRGSHPFAVVVFLLLMLLCLFLTFSRAAWIGAAVMLAVALWLKLPREVFRRLAIWGGISAVLFAIIASLAMPSVFFRLSSTRGHLVRPLEGLAMMIQNPFGKGLGSAGPASNRYSETCVFLRPQDNPDWAKSQPELCVFLGSTQVQPKDHHCICPFLPENWYVQVGVELGVVGLSLFIALILMMLRKLWGSAEWNVEKWKVESDQKKTSHFSTFHFPLFTLLSFLGISLAALFLHAWEDAAVAYTGWIIAAAAVSQASQRGRA